MQVSHYPVEVLANTKVFLLSRGGEILGHPSGLLVLQEAPCDFFFFFLSKIRASMNGSELKSTAGAEYLLNQ